MEEEKKKFSEILKSNNIKNIFSFITTKNKFLRHQNKVDIIISNLCSLNISNIADIIKLMNLKPTDGSKIPLYIKAIECKPHIFGFINSYFSVSKHLRFSAYGYAAKINRIDILKKIRDIDLKNFKKIYDYVLGSRKFSQEVKDFVKQDFKKAISKKDISPEDFLKYKLKKQVKQKFSEAKKRKAVYIKNTSALLKSLNSLKLHQ